jgi:hypothetical protein
VIWPVLEVIVLRDREWLGNIRSFRQLKPAHAAYSWVLFVKGRNASVLSPDASASDHKLFAAAFFNADIWLAYAAVLSYKTWVRM